MSHYLFDNTAEQTSDRFSVLESRYDPVSRSILDQTGLAPGWRCLEVGGGGGSLANWLGERVGPDGEVTVTDIEPRWAVSRQRRANVHLLRHDITRDPLPGDGFDLVHARLVLNHLPERLRVLDRLVEALRPGGWLVLEDFDTGWTPVLAAPDEASAALFERVYTVLLGLLEKAGAEPRWGRHALGAMMRAGLEAVDATTYAEAWHGRGEGINLHRANVEQMADRLKEVGVSDGELDRFLALLNDPGFVVNSCALISTWGRRPRLAAARMSHRIYLEERLPLAEEPLRLMARLARSGLFDQYMVYENGSEWSFAGGALASVRLGADARDLTVVEERLADVPVADWRAYGWAAFELGAALAGADAGDAATLLYLVVPTSEVRADGGTVLVRSVDQEQLDRLVHLIDARDDGAAFDSPERVELTVEDTGNYRAAVAAILAELRADAPLQKVILSRRVPIPVPVDLTASYVAGRRSNTPARSFLLNLGGIRATGFSPETVVEVAGGPARRVVSHPLAGTRARTGSAADDARLRADLLSDPKEIHEHAISVKLALEDLATVCDETNVTEYLTVQERGSVQHLASTVTGRLRDGQSSWQAFAALFPAVTATGIPKAAAYPIIRALEGRPRGLYAGAVITCDSVGNLDAALVLRTVFEQGGSCWLQAGAGIVQQSRPEREHEETCEKLFSIAKYLVPAARPMPPTLR